MEQILISACLVGDNCTYKGGNNYSPKIRELLEHYELIPFCPEVEGGLRIPRDPSERKGDRVVSIKGKDVTKEYELGARRALNICQALKVKVAILQERSPSCGVHLIHDGSFSNKLIKGEGTTTELLRSHGIKVLTIDEIDELLK